jgi:hypothetical protein
MIRVLYSPEPYHELELEGSNAELAALRDRIQRFANGQESEIKLSAESSFHPSPCERALAGLLVRKTLGRIVLTVEGDILVLSGKPAYLRIFADNLPIDADETSTFGYHVHFDRAGREDHVSEDSLDIVLALRDTETGSNP